MSHSRSQIIFIAPYSFFLTGLAVSHLSVTHSISMLVNTLVLPKCSRVPTGSQVLRTWRTSGSPHSGSPPGFVMALSSLGLMKDHFNAEATRVNIKYCSWAQHFQSAIPIAFLGPTSWEADDVCYCVLHVREKRFDNSGFFVIRQSRGLHGLTASVIVQSWSLPDNLQPRVSSAMRMSSLTQVLETRKIIEFVLKEEGRLSCQRARGTALLCS